MELSASETIDAAPAAVFAVLTDFDRIEAQLRAQGASITRTPAAEGALVGTAWNARFSMRGKARTAATTLAAATPPERLVFETVTSRLDIETHITLSDAKPQGTVITVTSILAPRSLSARLIVQSLRLARGQVADRFATRVSAYVAMLGDRPNDKGRT